MREKYAVDSTEHRTWSTKYGVRRAEHEVRGVEGGKRTEDEVRSAEDSVRSTPRPFGAPYFRTSVLWYTTARQPMTLEPGH